MLFHGVEDEMRELSAKAGALAHEQLDEPKVYNKAWGQGHHSQQAGGFAEKVMTVLRR